MTAFVFIFTDKFHLSNWRYAFNCINIRKVLLSYTVHNWGILFIFNFLTLAEVWKHATSLLLKWYFIYNFQMLWDTGWISNLSNFSTFFYHQKEVFQPFLLHSADIWQNFWESTLETDKNTQVNSNLNK